MRVRMDRGRRKTQVIAEVLMEGLAKGLSEGFAKGFAKGLSKIILASGLKA